MGVVTKIGQTDLALMFLYAAILGAVFGVGYDVFRILRRAGRAVEIRPRKGKDSGINPVSFILIFLQDVLFFTASAAVSTIFFYKFNSGRVRLSGVAFILLGFAAYHFTLGQLVMLAADAIINFVSSIFRLIAKILKLIFTPVFNAAKFLIRRVKCALRLLELRRYTRFKLLSYRKLLN